MIKGETVLSGGQHPGTKLQVLQSPHGWYVGFLDEKGAPYSRETLYFRTRKGAQSVMDCLRSAAWK